MTIQQLRYVICIAECSSMGEAAIRLHISQPALSIAIKDLEREIGRKIFQRGTRGMTLTLDGLEFLSYARQVIQQVSILERKYVQNPDAFKRLTISTQHYTFIVKAFIDTVTQFSNQPYIFNFRETTTSGIIDDVAKGYSELGILFCSSYNEKIMRAVFAEHNIEYTDLLWQTPHVLIASSHPLGNRSRLTLADLEPYPCITYDRGRGASLYYAEEVLSDRSLRQNIRVTDRYSCVKFILHNNAYNIGIGFLSSQLGDGIIAIPMDVDEYIRVVRIQKKNTKLSTLAEVFIQNLEKIIADIKEEAPAGLIK